jgi:hypothetical protein
MATPKNSKRPRPEKPCEDMRHTFRGKKETMERALKKRRKEMGVSLDELAAVLGPGFSRARLSVAERGLIALSVAEQDVISAAIERLGSLRSEARSIAERAMSLDFTSSCNDIRQQAQAIPHEK